MKKFIVTTIIAVVTLASPLVHADRVDAVMTVYDSPSSPFTFTANKGTMTFSYSSGATVSQIAAGDDYYLANQNYGTVGDGIETIFGLTTNPFTAATVGESADISGSSATIISNMPYDYLAVHFGGYEVFFHFAELVATGTAFQVFDVTATRGGGLSNYRVYDSGLSAVPLPAALLMFAPALLGFMGLRRKANK
jgi:hypothetical protein